ncbi:hypothetical protein GCM10010306_026530 [Streptomyces umbrinus]|nr:hypothetical protein GCM10010306_026530 [Streptomyces umbrinus]
MRARRPVASTKTGPSVSAEARARSGQTMGTVSVSGAARAACLQRDRPFLPRSMSASPHASLFISLPPHVAVTQGPNGPARGRSAPPYIGRATPSPRRAPRRRSLQGWGGQSTKVETDNGATIPVVPETGRLHHVLQWLGPCRPPGRTP